jgi:DNA-binding NarL/FixJ family response regulator
MPSRDALDSDFVSIVVADGTRIHTQLLADALRHDRGLQVVAAASNSEELLAAVTRVPIDVVVISHNLDDQPGHGTQVLREMRALRPQIKGVILLDTSKSEEVLECFRAGARGVFSKQERLETLCKCIRTVHDGQIWARSSDLEHALEALANSPLVRTTSHNGMELLSPRECQVIQHVAAGMSNREIADALELSPHTVKNYLFRIFDKLGVSSRTELLYLTMNRSSAAPSGAANGDGLSFSRLIEAAEAGDPSAQLRLAKHFSQAGPVQSESHRTENGRIHDGQNQHRRNGHGQTENGPVHAEPSAGTPPDPVSAYTWFLLAERTTAPILEQIELGKTNIRRTMSPEQLQEAEGRAAAWLKNTPANGKQHSVFAANGDAPSAEPKHKNTQSGVR